MTDHDPLCPPYMMGVAHPCPVCEVITKVRADERDLQRALNRETEGAQAYFRLADLRAKVEALPGNDPLQNPERRAAYEYAIETVLDLINEAANG